METNISIKWTRTLKFLQDMQNTVQHQRIKCLRQKIMFRVPMKLGNVNSLLPPNLCINSIEEDIKVIYIRVLGYYRILTWEETAINAILS